MKALYCAIAASVLFASLPTLQAAAQPAESDFFCYVRTSVGRVIDLTQSMCTNAKAAAVTTTTLTNTDSELPFIRNYKQRVSLVENPAAARFLTQQANQIPGKLTDLGASVCNGFASKLNRPQIISIIEQILPTDNQDALMHYAGLQRVSILLDMAEAGVCP